MEELLVSEEVGSVRCTSDVVKREERDQRGNEKQQECSGKWKRE